MLQFRLGPFPVRIELSFLIVAALFGGLGYRGLPEIAAWIGVVFVSVLIHELGHALVGLSLGGRPEIILQGMGGVTFPRLRRRTSWAQQIWLSVAGPLAGLIPGAVALGVLIARHPALGESPAQLWQHSLRYLGAREPLDQLLATFVETSGAWTALNLMPVQPLDGGHVLEIALTAARKKPSAALASWVSAAVAAILAVAIFVVAGGWWTAGVFFCLLAFSSANRARALARGAPVAGQAASPDAAARAQVGEALGQARAALSQGDLTAAVQIAEALETAPDGFRQAAAARIRAGVALTVGENLEAGRQAGRAYSLAPSPDAAVVAARAALRGGQLEVAKTWLKRALEAGAPPEALRDDPELGALGS